MREHDLDFDREFFGRYIAQRLSDRRKSLDITLVELAKRLGLKHPTITGILNGRALASISKYWSIARQLGYSHDEFDALVVEARRAELVSRWITPSDSGNIDTAIRQDFGVSSPEAIERIKEYIELMRERYRDDEAPPMKGVPLVDPSFPSLYRRDGLGDSHGKEN